MPQTLAQMVRAKYPGAYDDLSDQQLESQVRAKFPGVYDDLPTTQGQQAQGPQGSVTGRFFSNLGEMVNPVAAAKGLYQAVRHPIETGTALAGAQIEQGRQAVDLFRQGRYSEAVGHGGAALLPVLGPVAAQAGEQIGSGDVAGGLGKTAGLLVPFGAAEGFRAVQGARVPGLPSARTAGDVAAIEAGQRAGVPIDAATATGNRAVRAVQHVSDRTIGGSMVGARAERAQAQGLATMGEQLAAKGYPVAVSPETAGGLTREAVLGNVKQTATEANQAYAKLRKIEADPKHARTVTVQKAGTVNGQPTTVSVQESMPLPVDLRPAKASLKPIYDDLLRQKELTAFAPESGKARALDALDRLMRGGADYAPLSTVDAALSDLKAFTRSGRAGEVPALATEGQGAAKLAIGELEKAVDATARQAGPEAINALKQGRAATVAKYRAADVLDELRAEPVQAYRQATQAGDLGINRLRELAREAPKELPALGRAFLDSLLDEAKAVEGGFGKRGTIASKWEKLGPQTKMLLYRDPSYVKDLDNFFHLLRLTADNPNPSGTAHTLLVAGQGGLILTDPITGGASVLGTALLSQLLRSRRGVQLLTKGLKLPLGSRAAQAAYTAELSGVLSRTTSPSALQTAPAPAR